MRKLKIGDRVKFGNVFAVITNIDGNDLNGKFYTLQTEGPSVVMFSGIPESVVKYVGPNWEVGRSHVNVKESVIFALPVGSLLGVVALNHWGGLEYEKSDPENTIFVARISGRKVFIHSTGIQMSAKDLSALSEKKALKVLYLGEK